MLGAVAAGAAQLGQRGHGVLARVGRFRGQGRAGRPRVRVEGEGELFRHRFAQVGDAPLGGDLVRLVVRVVPRLLAVRQEAQRHGLVHALRHRLQRHDAGLDHGGFQAAFRAHGAAGFQPARLGPRVLRTGSTLGFVDAQVLADEALIARANATFRMLPRTDRPGAR